MAAMCPRFLQLHRFSPKSAESFALESEDDNVIMVNPRRVDYYHPLPPPNNPNQRNLYCGTYVALGSNKHVVVRETTAKITSMLKK